MNMFWELLEAVIKCMIVFQELNFDPVKEIRKIRCHIYILMKKWLFWGKYMWKWSLLLHIQYENRKSWLVQIPEAATWGVLRTKAFFKMSQNSQETPVPEETPVNFAKFLKTPLLQNNSGRLLLKCGHFNNEARDIDCICCRELDALLYCFG